MANVLFTRTSDPSSKPITDGQLIFDTSGNGKMYLDNGTTRLEMGGAINVDATLDATSTNPIQNKAVAGVMLSTLEEIDKVTSKGKLTDALATKELNTKVTDLETDVSSLKDDYVSKGKILGSLEEVTTATNAGFVPDALAIKELDTDLQGQIDTLNRNFSDKYIVRSYSANFTTNPGYGYFLVNGNITIAGYKIISTMVNQKDTSIAGGTYFIANVFGSQQLFLNYYSSGNHGVQIEVLVLYIKE